MKSLSLSLPLSLSLVPRDESRYHSLNRPMNLTHFQSMSALLYTWLARDRENYRRIKVQSVPSGLLSSRSIYINCRSLATETYHDRYNVMFLNDGRRHIRFLLLSI